MNKVDAETIALIKALGGSGGGGGEKFVVTLTPTALDYSGTMDKTIAEINEAYEAGQQIVWRVIMGADRYVDVDVTAVMTDEDYAYPSFNAFVIEIGSSTLIYAHIPVTNDGTKQTYSTKVYPLASSGGGVLVVGATFTETTMTLNKTWQEIHDADVAFVVVTDPWGNAGSKEPWLVCSVFGDDLEGRYVVFVMDIYQQDQYECVATSKSGYPVFQQS